MIGWEKQCLDLLNQGHFSIVDAGPLHAPVRGFSIHRDDNLHLILETEADPNAAPAVIIPADGMTRLSTESARLVNIAGVEAVLTGVQPYGLTRHEDWSQPHRSMVKETARVSRLTMTPGDLGEAAYTIEWLENVPVSPFIWPDAIETVSETKIAHRLAFTNDGLTVSSSNNRGNTSWNAAKLTVESQTFYVCALSKEERGVKAEPGCIIYAGMPDELLRRKIRVALSFCLGVYLVEMGHTFYDANWQIVSATSRSAYSLTKRTFGPGPMPLAHLSRRNYLHDLDRAGLTRMVNALVTKYDELDLGNLSWAYWHACAATVHIAPVHFGAAIEALLRASSASHPDTVRTTIIQKPQWRVVREAINAIIDAAEITEDSKRAMKDKTGEVNRAPLRAMLDDLVRSQGLQLSAEEYRAWQRRNAAAHGNPIPEGHELDAIQDMKRLRGLFNRLLLSVTGAADFYIDYSSPNRPPRRLQDAPSP